MSIPTETITDQSLAEKGFYWREQNGVKAIVCEPLEKAGFVNGFSTRLGGVSPFPANDLNLAGYDEDSAENIAENRRRFLSLFAGDWRLASCWQVHSDLIRHVKNLEDAADGNYKMDALISDVENVLLGVKTADCVPVLLGDTRAGAFAAVHAGWRGTVASIVPKTVREMQAKFGTNPACLIAAIGPAASGACYEVGADVIELFQQNFPEEAARYFTPTRENHALVDLFAANREQLMSVGVFAENIYTAPFCTMTRTDLFFSYRVEKKTNGKTGRLMSVIGRK
jgi:polyphenol oxidase